MKVLVVWVAAVAFVLGGAGSVGGCSSSSSSSGSAGAGTATCTAADGTTCPSGAGILQLCLTGESQCTGAYFTVGSQTFNCNSCTDTTACEDQAAAACFGDAGTGSGSGSSGSSSGGSTGVADGATD